MMRSRHLLLGQLHSRGNLACVIALHALEYNGHLTEYNSMNMCPMCEADG